MVVKVAVSKCACGRLNYVIKGPRGPEIVCDCGEISQRDDDSISWDRPIARPPRYAMTRED